MKIKLIALSIVASALFLGAQEPHNCGVDHEADTQVKERMLNNRSNISAEVIENIRSNRTTIYVPVTFHNIGLDNTDKNHESYADLNLIFDTFCRLQEDYAVFGVQFYLNMPIRYIADTDLYNNSHDNNAYNTMGNHRVNGSLNIFVGPSVESAVSSYYSPGEDFVFMLRSMMGYPSPTIWHEVGHFFSLPHTFYGWEDIDARDYAGGNSPSNLGWGSWVEEEPRTGGNCAYAADGFCDTPADYISFRAACPMNYDLRDPDGIAIDPDETNIMSYYMDECVSVFSTEQQNAIIADIVDRNWDNFPAPNLDVVSSSYTLDNQYPEDDALIEISTSNGELTLTWDAVPNAAYYYVKIDSSHFNSNVNTKIGILKRDVIEATANPSYTLTYDELLPYDKYRWTVVPFTLTGTCVDEHTFYRFDITSTIGVIDLDNDDELSVYPTIISDANPYLKTTLDITKIELLSINGGLVDESTNSLEALNMSSLANGVYYLKFYTEDAVLTRRVVVQH